MGFERDEHIFLFWLLRKGFCSVDHTGSTLCNSGMCAVNITESTAGSGRLDSFLTGNVKQLFMLKMSCSSVVEVLD